MPLPGARRSRRPVRPCLAAVAACGVLAWLAVPGLRAQPPVQAAPPPAAPPAASPAPAAPAASTPAPTAPTAGSPASATSTPAPVPPGVPKVEGAAPTPPESAQDTLVDALNPGELQEAINLLRANYVRPPEVDDRAIARATVTGLLSRLDHGAMLLPKPGAPQGPGGAEPMPDAFRAEILRNRVGYARLGSLTRDHLGELDRAVKDFAGKNLAAMILDLRATAASSDYELAADVIRRFVAKGKPLFTLRKPSNNQERIFTSNADPLFGGSVIVAVDADTAGAAETIAAVVRNYDRSLVVGTNTAGQAVEYADLRLSGGTLLRVAVSQVLLPANLSIFPEGLKPDLVVRMPRADKLAVFRQSLEKDRTVAAFVEETERPHFNEAALVSGVNPELDAARDAQAARRRGEPPPKPPLRDTVVQRALDLATTITTLGQPPVAVAVPVGPAASPAAR